MTVQPYLFFDGRCEEAIEFYKTALGAEVEMLMYFKDSPPGSHTMLPPDSDNKVMHASLKIGDTSVLASDGRCAGKPHFDGFSLSFTVKTGAEADKSFAALSDGGEVNLPLAKTFFRPSSAWSPTASASTGW
jgi:PhnB protein